MFKKTLILATMMLASQLVNAALYEYTYQGNQMSSDLSGFPDGIGALTVSFTLDQELDAFMNIDSGAINPLSWQVFDGITTITNETPEFFIVDFDLATNSTGDIIAWSIRLFSDPSTIPGLDRVFTTNVGNVVDGVLYCIDNNNNGSCTGLGAANVLDSPGTWSSSVVVPVPPAILLFVSALLVGVRLRK